MSAEGFKVQGSIKDGDGDMVNFRADSNDELAHYFDTFPYAAYAQAKANLRGASAIAANVQAGPPESVTQAQPVSYNGQNPAAPAPAWGTIPAQGGLQQSNPGQQWGQPAPQQQAPQQQGAQLHPEGLTCPIDGVVLQYKVVTRRSDQKQFKFWACPNQKNKDDGHRSEFAN